MAGFDFGAFARAWVGKDAERWLEFYAEDAEWVEYRDADPPSAPTRRVGRELIAAFLRGVADADVSFSLSDEIVSEDRAAFSVVCELADGRRIREHVALELAGERIVRQVDVEAWDPDRSGERAAERWLEAYGRAWVGRDPTAAAELFAEDALYAWGPFDELRGRAAIRERWARATADQRAIVFESELIGITGRAAVARWRCAFGLEEADRRFELDGVFVFALGADGRCTEFREWWRDRIVEA